MNFIIENWYIVLAFVCLGIVLGMTIYHFVLLPNDKKMAIFKNALANLVKQAEELVGSGNGEKKLEWVYRQVSTQFPFITMFLSDEEFKALVNNALVEVGIWLKK